MCNVAVTTEVGLPTAGLFPEDTESRTGLSCEGLGDAGEKVWRRRFHSWSLLSGKNVGGKHAGQSGGEGVQWKRSRSDEDKPASFMGWRSQLKPPGSQDSSGPVSVTCHEWKWAPEQTLQT